MNKLVASCITITTRNDFYMWLEALPWTFTLGEMETLANQAKYCKTALWSYQTGFRFW
jgi:hypothetical protein